MSSPGSCVINGAYRGQPVQENEGTEPVFRGANARNVIVPFSAGAWLAETYRSAPCLIASGTNQCGPASVAPSATSPAGTAVACIPLVRRGANTYGCDTAGNLVMNQVNHTEPVTPWPAVPRSVVSGTFSPAFTRTLYDVVSAGPGHAGQQPSDANNRDGNALEAFFGPKGYLCTNGAARKLIAAYSFEPLPSGKSRGRCGYAS